MAEDSDAHSVEAILSGDPAAAAWFVREHAPRVQRLLGRLLGARQDIEDLVQTTFLETLKALPGFKGQSSLSTFVLGVAVHVGRQAMRPRMLDRHKVALEGAPELPAHDALDERASDSEALRRVRALLERVAEPKRVAFMLWALEGMEVAEIANVMDASVPATRSRIFYAQRELLDRSARDPYLREWLAERQP